MSGNYYVVTTTYEIWEKYREEYLQTMELVRENSIFIGAIKYFLFEDDDTPNKFTEMMVFDSWSHYTRVAQKELSDEMRAVFEQMDTWTIGGPAAVEQKSYQVHLGEFPTLPFNFST